MKETPWLGRLLAGSVVALAAVGVVVAVVRVLFLEDALTIGEPYRHAFLLQMGLHDPFAAERLADAAWIDRRFALHPIVTLLHVVLGAALLVLGPLQFSRSLRARNIQFHRWSGRLLVLSTLVVVPTALFFGVVIPYGGRGEAVAVAMGWIITLGVAELWIRRSRKTLRLEDLVDHPAAINPGVAT